jgi:hypothetical protein
MMPSLSRLERALDSMIYIVSHRPDGESYVPIVLHLEGQIAELKSAESDYERILRLAAKTAA